MTSKFCWKSKGSSIAETFSNKINVENLSSKISWIIINFKYLGQYDTGIVIDQWNQIRANIYLHAYIYGTVIDHRCAIIEHCKYAWIVPKRCSNNCLLIWGGKKWNTTLHYTQKKHFQWEQRFQYEKQNFKIFRWKYRKITLWLQNRVKKKTGKFLAMKENTGIILIYNYIDGLNFCHQEWFLTKD